MSHNKAAFGADPASRESQSAMHRLIKFIAFRQVGHLRWRTGPNRFPMEGPEGSRSGSSCRRTAAGGGCGLLCPQKEAYYRELLNLATAGIDAVPIFSFRCCIVVSLTLP